MTREEPGAPLAATGEAGTGRSTAARGPCGRAAAGESLVDRFRAGEETIAVYGLGKMGLPIAATMAAVTGDVIGVDLDAERIDRIAAGDCPVTGEPGLAALLEHVVDGDLSVTTDGRAAAADAGVHVLVVPTVVHDTDVPDLSALFAVLEDVADGLAAGDLVCVESTVPPRTCSELVRPLLERRGEVPAGAFGVAFCPERTKSGRALRDVGGAHPKVVGGVDDASTAAAADLYRAIATNEVIAVADAATAESVKVFEGVYRDVNIALANELATYADELGVDVGEAIAAANTQPVCDIHDPGIGVGGHCIPYYPYFLLSTFRTDGPLMRTARAINDRMPTVGVRTLEAALAARGCSPDEARVAVLGLTYRPGVAETRKSPALPVAQQLAGAGATVFGVDPVLDDASEFPLELVDRDALGELELDAAVLVTAHREFGAIDWSSLPPMVVLDGRDALELEDTHHAVYTIGDGTRPAPRSAPGAGTGPGPVGTGLSPGAAVRDTGRSAGRTDGPGRPSSTDP